MQSAAGLGAAVAATMFALDDVACKRSFAEHASVGRLPLTRQSTPCVPLSRLLMISLFQPAGYWKMYLAAASRAGRVSTAGGQSTAEVRRAVHAGRPAAARTVILGVLREAAIAAVARRRGGQPVERFEICSSAGGCSGTPQELKRHQRRLNICQACTLQAANVVQLFLRTNQQPALDGSWLLPVLPPGSAVPRAGQDRAAAAPRRPAPPLELHAWDQSGCPPHGKPHFCSSSR